MAVADYKKFRSTQAHNSVRRETTVIAFDNCKEYLWVGDSSGHVSKYDGQKLFKERSLEINLPKPVVHVDTISDRVLSMTKDLVTCHYKTGVKDFLFTPKPEYEMTSGILYKDSNLLIGTKSSALIELDVGTFANAIRDFKAEGKMNKGVSMFRRGQNFIYFADINGNVTLRDPKTLRAEYVFHPHNDTLIDMDAYDYSLVTCGYTQSEGLEIHKFINIFDSRMMRSVCSVEAKLPPRFVRFMPTVSRQLVIVSEEGKFLIGSDAIVAVDAPEYQPDQIYGKVTGFAMSPSMEVLAFGDSGGHLHLWSSATVPTFHKKSTN